MQYFDDEETYEQQPNVVVDDAQFIGRVSPDGRWRIDGPKLGAGTSGAVFVGSNTATNEKVAIKLFFNEDWFEDELRIAESLNCAPFVMCVLGEFEMDDAIFIVYRKAEMDLQQYLAKHGFEIIKEGDRVYTAVGPATQKNVDNMTVPEEDRVSIVKSLLSALNNMIGAGIVHRDIKIANVLVYKDRATGKLSFGLGDMGTVCAYQKRSPQFPNLPLCDLREPISVTTGTSTPAHMYKPDGGIAEYAQPSDQKWVDIVGIASCLMSTFMGTIPDPSVVQPPVVLPSIQVQEDRVIPGDKLFVYLTGMMFSPTYEKALEFFRAFFLNVFNFYAHDGSHSSLHPPIVSRSVKTSSTKRAKRPAVKKTKAKKAKSTKAKKKSTKTKKAKSTKAVKRRR